MITDRVSKMHTQSVYMQRVQMSSHTVKSAILATDCFGERLPLGGGVCAGILGSHQVGRCFFFSAETMVCWEMLHLGQVWGAHFSSPLGVHLRDAPFQPQNHLSAVGDRVTASQR